MTWAIEVTHRGGYRRYQHPGFCETFATEQAARDYLHGLRVEYRRADLPPPGEFRVVEVRW